MRRFSLSILFLIPLMGMAAYAQTPPSSAAEYYTRGSERKLAGDFDGAIADYTKVIELDPQYALA